MDVAVWVVQGLLALAFLAAGAMKLTQDRKRLVDQGMAWAGDFSDGQVKGIGAVEVLGAVGLVLPAALGIAPVLTPIAAVGLALLMAGAVVTHLRRREYSGAVPSAVLGLLSVFVAVVLFA